MNPFQTAAFLSLDSFVISMALSQLPLRPAFRTRLMFSFGFFDGLASFAGAGLHLQTSERIAAAFTWSASVLLIIYLIGFLFKAVGRSRAPDLPNDRTGELPVWPLYALPLLASVDNLVDGGTSSSMLPSLLYAVALGCISGLASFVGFGLGTALSRRVPQNVRSASLALLVLFSVTLLLTH